MPPSVTVFYGSQTGASESIAQRFYDEALERSYDAELLPLNEFQNSKVAEIPGHHVIIVCSTTGNGEAPDNAGKFWRFVKRRTQPKDMLAHLHFTVLGLGDTNYDKFCYMGKSIDKRFTELGATRFYDACAADEAMGLEDSVEPWADGLWAAFDKSAAGASDAVTDSSSSSSENDIDNSAIDAIDAIQSEKTVDKTPPPFLPANLITYEAMFGPFSSPLDAPTDVPKLAAPQFTLRFIDETSDAAAVVVAVPNAPLEAGDYSATHPFAASIVDAQYLTAPHAERKVLRLSLDITGANIAYTPGDSIGIKCPNRTTDVDALLTRLQLRGDERFCVEPVASPATGRSSRPTSAKASGVLDRFPPRSTVRDALLHGVDLQSSPKKATLRTLATYCTDDNERTQMLVLSAKSGAEQYTRFVSDQQLSIVELLHVFPSCQPPLEHLLSLVPQLMPRFYSIASSPLADPNALTIAFTVVDHVVGANQIHRRGLCTNWLDALAQPLLAGLSKATEPAIRIPIFLRPTRDFVLPASHEWPLLLIGPGTGVAPFIGFLQHRRLEVARHAAQASDVCSGCWRGGIDLDLEDDAECATAPALAAPRGGGNVLFFGNRRRADDWIFRTEMEDAVANGTLQHLFTAFSRDDPLPTTGDSSSDVKHYVQRDLRANGALVADLLLSHGGYVFVCGDGVAMARDVHSALRDVLAEHGHLSLDDAEAQLKDLAARQRYVRDIWG